MTGGPRRIRRRRVLLLLLLVAGGAAAVAVRDYVVPKRFAEVEPGRIYRSGLMKPGPMRMVVDKMHIRRILTLLSEDPASPEQCAEREIAAEKGLHIERIPMPGNGCGTPEALDAAADFIADPSQGPVLVHCAAGVNRTSAAMAAYRMKHCGWSLEQAIAEPDRFGWSIRGNADLCRTLREYYDARIAATRPADGANRPRQDSNLQPSASEADALSN